MDHKLTANVRERADIATKAMIKRIEAAIASGMLRPGDRLPTERSLGIEYGLSRNTLRKGLQQLEAAGKIVRFVGRGAFVAPAAKAVVDRSLSERLLGVSPAAVMEVRLMLEPRAAELAATRASAAQLQLMDECLAQAGAAADVAAFEHWDGMLHRTIVEAAGNELLLGLYELVSAVRNQPEWAKLKMRTTTSSRRTAYQDDHSAVVRALRERDAPAARNAMTEHLTEVRAILIGEG